MNPFTALPTHVRRWIYFGYAALGIAFGATQVGYAQAAVDQPGWIPVAFAVFGYLGTALGLVAGSNTTDQPPAAAPTEVTVHLVGSELDALATGKEISATLDAHRRAGGKQQA